MTAGPLTGKRVLEFGGIGPAPFCGMLLADLGADVISIEAPGAADKSRSAALLDTRFDIATRGKRSLRVDLKSVEGRAQALGLLARADALIEGFRPGVMERLGLSSETCREVNKRLVYGRMTGWGQDGPLARSAGHDINYVALSGALHSIGSDGGPPTIPLNLLGDYAGGGLVLALGLVSAMLEAAHSGEGQVVDAAMYEGAALLMAAAYGFRAAGMMPGARGTNILDGGAHFYAVYECADHEWIAVGALEPAFYAELLRLCGIDDPQFRRQLDASVWPELKTKMAAMFRTRPRTEWLTLLEGTDACVAPILSIDDAPLHPQARAREAFVTIDGVTQPAPAPRFGRTTTGIRWGAPARPVAAHDVLAEWSAPA